MERNDLFDEVISYPDSEYLELYHSLVGLDSLKVRIVKELALQLDRESLDKWSVDKHGGSIELLKFLKSRPPLFVFAGDVGTGKTALAKSVGAEVAKVHRINPTLLPLSLNARGSGAVGEMTRLISQAFAYIIGEAKRAKAGKKSYILMIDEADAIAQSREETQMHHEDRAGVNALLRGIDEIAMSKLPVAVIMCTNRPGSLDPAVQRRAAIVHYFKRPVDEQRRKLLRDNLSELKLTSSQIETLVKETGGGEGKVGFTYSDFTQRLFPSIIMQAYPDEAITTKHIIEALKQTSPTPSFKEESTI